MQRILLISGHIASGKTELTRLLEEKYGFDLIKTSQYLKSVSQKNEPEKTRLHLQELGDKLDKETDGRWVRDYLAFHAIINNASFKVVVDAVRIESQISAIRELLGSRVVHAHLTAPREVLEERFERRKREGHRTGEPLSFSEATMNKTESEIENLKNEADLVIDTSRCDSEDVIVRVASRLGLFSPSGPSVDVIVGGQYGSEGKGHIAAYLAREYDVLLRVGGPNAGHSVASDSGFFVYHQLPSGCKDNNSRILIGPGAVINPTKFFEEIRRAEIDPKRIIVDRNAMIISDSHVQMEERLVKSIGSTGQGVGAATAAKIMGRDGSALTAVKSELFGDFVGDVLEELENAYARGQQVLLEGTQGTALSLHHGPYPYVTSRDTSVSGCLSEAGIAPSRVRRVILVVRPYPIRVANPLEDGSTSGWLKGEIDADMIASRSGLDAEEIRKKEKTSTTGRARRFGEFDWALFKRSCMLNCPTDVAFTFADYVSEENRGARRFDQLSRETILFVEELERISKAPVSLINTRFHRRSVIDRRDWKPSTRYG